MRLLDRYIGITVAAGTAVVMAVLLALLTFGSLVGELGNVGHGQYDLSTAIEYVALGMPRTACQLFPFSALLGSLLGLGTLAGHGELVVIRAAGVSVLRIAWSVLKVGLLLMLGAALVGQYVAPASEKIAQDLRMGAMTDKVALNTKTGLWMRDDRNIINIGAVLLDGHVGNVTIYQIDDNYALRAQIHARSALYRDHHWVLSNVTRSRIGLDGVFTSHEDKVVWQSLLSPELFDVVAVAPEDLSVTGLYQYIDYLRDNGLDARRYVLAFWQKLMSPLAAGVMLLISIPFVIGPLRLTSMGQRMLVGILLGTGFHLVNKAVGQSALFYHLNLVFFTTLPTLTFLAAALYLIHRVR